MNAKRLATVKGCYKCKFCSSLIFSHRKIDPVKCFFGDDRNQGRKYGMTTQKNDGYGLLLAFVFQKIIFKQSNVLFKIIGV